MAMEIDREITRLVTEHYERAKRVLAEQMVSLKAVAEARLEKESPDALDIDRIILQSSPVASAQHGCDGGRLAFLGRRAGGQCGA